MDIKIVSSFTRPDTETIFFDSIDLMNHILNEYVYPKKLWPVTELSDDRLTLTTTITFFDQTYLKEFLNDTIIKEFNILKSSYNKQHNIFSKSIIVNE